MSEEKRSLEDLAAAHRNDASKSWWGADLTEPAHHEVTVRLIPRGSSSPRFAAGDEYRPECVCGWTGSYLPTRIAALHEYEKHEKEGSR